MSKSKIILIFIVIFSIFSIVIFFSKQKSEVLEKSTVILGGKEFFVDLADTNLKRQKGLSESSPLLDNQGMFFIFESSGTHGFWMKDMLYSIDIIWIDQNMQITHIEKSAGPNSYPKTFYPNNPSMYVLEISSGQSEILGLKIGDAVEFRRK